VDGRRDGDQPGAAERQHASGKPTKADLDACWELGATVVAQLMG
jgi:hypothetical protein